MLCRAVMMIAVLGLIASRVTGQEMRIQITNLTNNMAVPEEPTVEGKVSNSKAEVWVIVHPMKVSDYWVQQPVTVMDGGTFEVIIHIGRSGSIDVGKKYEIMVVANPRDKLEEGKILRGWPVAQAKSQVIKLIRK